MGIVTFDVQGIEQFIRDFDNAYYDGDFVRMASFYADDAKLLSADTEMAQGRKAIELLCRKVCEQGRTVGKKRATTILSIDTSGDLGYLEKTNRW
jgi:ketosteroid isomerase-like protein